MDIVVTYNKKQKLSFGEKISSVKDGYTTWWNFGKKPKLVYGDKIFVCYKDKIRGYFEVERLETTRNFFLISQNIISDDDWNDLMEYVANMKQIPRGYNPYQESWVRKKYGWSLRKVNAQAHLIDWKKIKAIQMKGFRGFRIRRFEYEE